MASAADLEKITDRLEQAYAILTYSSSAARLAAVRLLLKACRSEELPTRAARAIWGQIAESLLRLGREPATGPDAHRLAVQIRQLREAILNHLAAVDL